MGPLRTPKGVVVSTAIRDIRELSAAAKPEPSGGSMLRDGEGPRYTVLYVEDNPSNIAFMQELVTELERVELISAPNAEIGIELARA